MMMIQRDDGGAGCPRAAEAGAYLANKLTEDEALAFEEHYFSCDRCWAEVHGGLEIRAALGEAAGTRRGLPRWLPLAAAAGLAGIALVGFYWTRPVPPAEPVHREGPAATLSIHVTTEPSAERLVASWEPVPGADRYVVSLLDAAGNGLMREETRDTRFAVGRASLARAIPGELYWRVRAEDELRRPLADSGPVRAGLVSREAP